MFSKVLGHSMVCPSGCLVGPGVPKWVHVLSLCVYVWVLVCMCGCLCVCVGACVYVWVHVLFYVVMHGYICWTWDFELCKCLTLGKCLVTYKLTMWLIQ